jgi:hypothetical protein
VQCPHLDWAFGARNETFEDRDPRARFGANKDLLKAASRYLEKHAQAPFFVADPAELPVGPVELEYFGRPVPKPKGAVCV